MYGTGTGVGTGLAVTGISVGSQVLTGLGLLFAGGAFLALTRRSNKLVRP